MAKKQQWVDIPDPTIDTTNWVDIPDPTKTPFIGPRQVPGEGDDDWWTGAKKSFTSGEVGKTVDKSMYGLLKDTITTLPGNLWGAAKMASHFANPMAPLIDAAMGRPSPAMEDIKNLKKIPSQIYEAGARSPVDPAAFGGMMGQMAVQPLLTEGLVKGAGAAAKIPVKATIRAAGVPVENVGNIAKSAVYLPYVPKSARVIGGLGGYGLEKLGQYMQGVGGVDANAIALDKFYGGPKPPPAGPPPPPTIGTGQADIWDQMLGESRPPSDIDALRDFYGGEKSAPVLPSEPVVSSGGADIWDQILGERRPQASSATLTETSPGTQQFGERLPLGELGSPDPHLPFGEAGGEPQLPFYEPRPPATPLGKNAPHTVTIEEPTPLKVAELQHKGYEPLQFNPDGSLKMVRRDLLESAPTEAAPTEAPAEVAPTEELPDKISKSNWTREEVRDLLDKGYVQGGQDPITGQAQMVRGPKSKGLRDFFTEEEGSVSHQEIWDNLKRLLGRAPTEEEVAAAVARQVRPGETTGRVSEFPTQQRQEFQRIANEQNGQGETPPAELSGVLLSEGGLDVSKTRQGNVLGPPPPGPEGIAVQGVDEPVSEHWLETPEGQKYLPLGPHSEFLPRELESDIWPRPSETPPVEEGPQPTQGKLKLRPTTGLRKADLDKIQANLNAEDELQYLGHHYARTKLDNLPQDGSPGLTYKPGYNKGGHITYRDTNGKPVAYASIDMDGKILSLVADKERGLLYGRALKSVGKKLIELGATEPYHTYSKHTADLIKNLSRFLDDVE